MDRALPRDEDRLASGRRLIPRLRSLGIGGAVAIAIVTLSSSVLAQEPSADELKTRGNQAMMELNYAEALSAYRAALVKNPNDVALHYNIGRAHQARGDYPAALDALHEFEHKAPAETKAKVPSLGQLIADVKSHVGELTVHCSSEVTRGTVIVDATTKLEGCSVTPKKVRVSLTARSATLEIRLESDAFQAPSVKVNVEGGGAPVDVALAVGPRSNAGILRVQATPAVAVVSVDGVPKGNSPVELSLPAGSHVVDVNADAYEGAHVPFVLEAGGKKELSLTLEKTPPITKRWWFWTGAGVVAAGIATAAVILIVQPERDSSKGIQCAGSLRVTEEGVRIPQPGETVAGKYRLLRLLGEGGMGMVLAAEHLRLRQPIAIKFLNPKMLGIAEIVERFDREARAAATLRSRHVVRVTDVEQTPEGVPYMVMELLEGADLESERERRAKLPWSEAVDYV
ncbi:MAG: serine/threonine protein kinase, partial [Labilithrix sp.]|nr:serine/threonine protein kinase [Labilithrix sp.]